MSDPAKGLAAIAKSGRRAKAKKLSQPTPSQAAVESADHAPTLQLVGRIRKTSIAVDEGMWNCAQDLVHVLSKRQREVGQSKVPISKLFLAAFASFQEKPIEEQLTQIRKYL